MSITLYMDVHVPRAITIGARLREVDVLIAQENNHRTAEYDMLLDRTTKLGRILFAQDDQLFET